MSLPRATEAARPGAEQRGCLPGRRYRLVGIPPTDRYRPGL